MASSDTITDKTGATTPDSFVFIIGAMKSGTTSLFEILGQHPQICPSKIKEPDYFVKDRDAKARREYLALWDWRKNKHRYALESSVAYTKAPVISNTPVRIQDAKLGKYRFIYMIRNPVSRIESQVRHGLFAGWGKSLDEGIPDDAMNFSRYAMQLDNYLARFPREDFLVIPLEEFKQAPDIVLTRICQFLHIDTDYPFTDITTTRNSGDFFNAPATISRLTQGRTGQFIAQKILPGKIKTLIRNVITRLGSTKKETSALGRWRLTDEEKETVLRELADDIQRIATEYNIDVQKYWQIPPEILEKT